MEWRIFIQRGAPVIERRTAVVQLSDARMILVVQVSQMKSADPLLNRIITTTDTPQSFRRKSRCGQRLRVSLSF